jgi:tetratricopeptide (TPR) repeat protein
VRLWIVRGAIVSGLVLLGWVLWLVLSPYGFAWIVWVLAGLLAAAVAIELVVRATRVHGEGAQWEVWRRAMEDDDARQLAIDDARARIDRARRFGPRKHLEHARLAAALAELLEAAGRSQEAIDTLAKVPVDALDPIPQAVVRHARALAYLHAGDIEGAAAALALVPERVEPVLDASIAIARGVIALGQDRLDDAERFARDIEAKAEEGDELHDEALALQAAVLLAREKPDEARALIARIDEGGRRRLALIGPALIRRAL